jgi:hypothetical protein
MRGRCGVQLALFGLGLLLCDFCVLCGESQAELPLIRLDRVFPLGGEAGSEVTLELAGRDLDEAKSLHFDGPGFSAELVKPNQFKLKIAADVAPGVYDVCAVGKYGISAGRAFSVCRGLSEVLEKEPNDTAESAQAVPFNAAVNGNSDANADDYFRFTARKGQRVLLDAQAFRLDSTLRPVLSVASADGKVLARSRPYFHLTDPLLDLVIPDDGEYTVGLHDATYLGGQPYRLVISDRPQVENAFPGAVFPGEKAELTIYGRNLPGGKPAQGSDVNGLPLDELTLSLDVPNDSGRALGFLMLAPLPSATLAARGMQVWPKPLQDALNPVTLITADAPVTREQEPNDAADHAQSLPLPTFLAGRFDKPGDADWFTVTAKRGDSLAVEVFCERGQQPGDARVIVTNAKGNEVASFDDHGIRFNSLDMYNRDPQGTFNVPEDGTYRLLVQETYGHGGARFCYVVRVGRAKPDFFPVVFHETPSDPTCPVVRQGGSAFVEFCANRRDGFNGPITVEAEGLPPGVTCPPTHVSPQSQFTDVVFTAAADAPEWSGAVRLKAWAAIDGQRVERPVHVSRRRWPIPNISTSRASREILLAVRAQAPYGLKSPAQAATVAAGGSVDATVTVERRWPEFKGKVQINGLNLPPGFGVNTTEIPEGKTEAQVKVTVAANVPPGDYTVNLRGDAQVPFSADPKAANRPNVRVADPATPLTVTVTKAK